MKALKNYLNAAEAYHQQEILLNELRSKMRNAEIALNNTVAEKAIAEVKKKVDIRGDYRVAKVFESGDFVEVTVHIYGVVVGQGTQYSTVKINKDQFEPEAPLAFTSAESRQKLQDLEREQNGGRGVSCVRTLIAYINAGGIVGARAVCDNEWDKISNYPEIAQLLIDEFKLDPVHYYIKN